MPLEVEVLPDADAVAERGAEVVAETAAAAIAERGRFTFAVSGGRTPWAMFAGLYGRLPWEKVTIFQVDERIAPDGDPDRNLTQLQREPAGRRGGRRAGDAGLAPRISRRRPPRTRRRSPTARPRAPRARGRTGTPPRSSRAIPCSTWPIATSRSPACTRAGGG